MRMQRLSLLICSPPLLKSESSVRAAELETGCSTGLFLFLLLFAKPRQPKRFAFCVFLAALRSALLGLRCMEPCDPGPTEDDDGPENHRDRRFLDDVLGSAAAGGS